MPKHDHKVKDRSKLKQPDKQFLSYYKEERAKIHCLHKKQLYKQSKENMGLEVQPS